MRPLVQAARLNQLDDIKSLSSWDGLSARPNYNHNIYSSMPIPKIHTNEKHDTYFLTLTVNNWANVFTTEKYFQLLIKALRFYQNVSDLRIYGYVIMTNHMHIIASCSDMIKFIRGYKTFTSKGIRSLIMKDHRKWLYRATIAHKKSTSIWQAGNWPITIETDWFFQQKLDYIHFNPVVEGYVEKPEDWKYSSAKSYYIDEKGLINVENF